jgi:hypothetical protein
MIMQPVSLLRLGKARTTSSHETRSLVPTEAGCVLETVQETALMHARLFPRCCPRSGNCRSPPEGFLGDLSGVQPAQFIEPRSHIDVS